MPPPIPRITFPTNSNERKAYLAEVADRLTRSGECVVVFDSGGSHTVRVLEVRAEGIMYVAYPDEALPYERTEDIPRNRTLDPSKINHIFLNMDQDDDER